MSQSGLLRKRNFYPLFWTQFLGAFNDNFLKNALVILITFKATEVLGIPPSQMVVLSGGIFILPYFLFSATAGQLADKYEKGMIIRIIKAAEIAIMTLATAGFLTTRYELLLATLFFMGLHSTFFGPIKYSILPQHIGEEELVGANALIEAGTFLSILLGTILGGILISVEGYGPTLVSGGLLAAAIGGFWISRRVPEAPPVDRSIRVQWNPIPPTVEILKFAARSRPVFLSILGISWFWFFGASFFSLFPHYCKDYLNADQRVITLFLAIFSIGIGVGSLLCERLSRERLELGLVPLGSIGMTLFALDLFLCGKPSFSEGAAAGSIGVGAFLGHWQGLRILMDLLLLSVFSGFFIVPLYTMVQELSEASHRSRIIAANNVVNALLSVASAIVIMGMDRMGFSIPKMFLVLALLNGAVAVYIYTLLPEFLIRFLIWIVANLMYRVRVTGGQGVPVHGPAVFVCNHVSFVDWMLLAAGIRRPLRFVMHFDFFNGFLIKRIMRRLKVIPIASAKEDPKILEAAYLSIADELGKGELVCIFPEGKITRDGKLSPFKPGVLKILQATPVPVVPMSLNGMWGSFFSRESGRAMSSLPRRFWFPVELRIGSPIPAGEVTIERLEKEVTALGRS